MLAGRGDEMGKEKQADRGKLGPKSNGNIENSFKFPEFEF
jgi:hypothetical protein